MMSKITTCVVACFLFCLVLILSESNKDFENQNDPYEYALLGRSLCADEGLRFNNMPDVVLPPGFPIFIGLVDKIIGNMEWSGKTITIISFLVSIFLIYTISTFFFYERQFSILAVILFATNSNLLFNASNGYSESLFELIFLTIVWVTLNLRKKDNLSLGHVIIFSLLWITLYYIRPEGLIIGIILFLWLATDVKNNTCLLWSMPLICLILIFPYLFFLKTYTGHWQLSGKTYLNLVMGEVNSPYQKDRADEIIDDRYAIIGQTLADPSLSHGVVKYWKQPNNDIIQRIPVNLIKLGKIYWFTFSLVGIALWIWGIINFNRKHTFFLLSLFLPIAIYLIFFILPRNVAIYHWVWIIFMVSGLKNIKPFFETKLAGMQTKVQLWTTTLLISIYQIRAAVKAVYDFLSQ